jgi:DNA-binding response OmpR family regulator
MGNLRDCGNRVGVILLVDDNEIVRKFIRAFLLRIAAWEILMAASGDEALTISRSFDNSIDLVISDIDMPGMDGLALCERLVRERPNIGVVLISGLPLIWWPDGVTFLPKPFTPSALKTAVETAMRPAEEE